MTAPETTFPREYVNKTVSLKFMGRQSVFHLSHGLFSSNDIDAGTRLLLKNAAVRLDLSRRGSILDVGCGVGVIGTCLARACPGARVLLQDRDALAAAFARENCRANGIQGAEIDCGLALWHLAGQRFDLVLSNLPAKAGPPVLQSFFQSVPGLLSPQGVAGVVIVAPLADLARNAIRATGCSLSFEENTRQHSVFFFSTAKNPVSRIPVLEELAPYLRGRRAFSAFGIEYELETVYGLADFDTLGHAVELALEILLSTRIPEDLLFWNPGQGHLPVAAQKKAGRRVGSVQLAGHDALELVITERNLAAAGRSPSRSLLVPTEAGLGEAVQPASVDLLCALPDPVPKAPWHRDLARSAQGIVRPGGALLAAGRSTDVFRVLDQCQGFKLVESRKRFGCRAVLMRRV